MIVRTLKRMKAWYINTINGLMDIESEEPVLKPVPKRYPINLCIGDETITLNVTEDTEAAYRMASKRINDDYKRFKQNYPDTPSEKLYALIALKEALTSKS